MPIHINLLAEAQAAEELRRRDPVKRAIFIGLSLAAVALMWLGMVEVNSFLARELFARVQAEINATTNAYQHVKSDQTSIGEIKAKLAALQKLQAARFLQGNLLNALQCATVSGVQLTRLRVEQSYISKEGTASAAVREKIMLYLDARDFSANPGDQVNKFREAIPQQDYFKAMLDKTNGVKLANPPSAPQMGAGKPYVTFTLNCLYPEVSR
ncbi:MAG: hypothetical protein ABSE90_02315 [Verrucomicrobiota bacterium]|jgi:hypothetical protein